MPTKAQGQQDREKMEKEAKETADRIVRQFKAQLAAEALEVIYGPGDTPTRDEAERRLKKAGWILEDK